tara:strand:- start:7724 stop:8143 length:420 start_codon:yes stop_codon:yes gene_type:complete
MGIRIPQIPDELLENIRQYIGNCRIYDGELIMTLDKKSKKFMNLEYLIKRRLDRMIDSNRFTLADGILMLLDNLGRERKSCSWLVRSLWRQDKHNRRYRFIIYRYYADTNTLIFYYKRKETQSKKDPFKKNIDIEYVIP